VKSHGGADEKGVAAAIAMAANLVGKGFRKEVSETVALVVERAGKTLEAAE
jgi:fatty acid/phospholipid biosynthesis enzyme